MFSLSVALPAVCFALPAASLPAPFTLSAVLPIDLSFHNRGVVPLNGRPDAFVPGARAGRRVVTGRGMCYMTGVAREARGTVMIDRETTENLKRRVAYEKARPGYPDGFPHIPDLSAERYISPEFYELEIERLWTNTWLYAGHKDQLPETGSYIVFDRVPRMPVFVVRGEDGTFRAFYNTCAHRGGCIVSGEEGRCGTRLMCGYHAWTYDLEGNLVGVPDSRDFEGLVKADRGLTRLRCETWGGMIFVNANPEAPPLRDYLAILADEFRQFDLDDLALISRYHYDVPCNWKVLMDAFAENYHFVSVHRGTVGLPGPKCAVDHRGTVMALFENGHSRNILPWNTGFEPKAGSSEETGFSMSMGGIEDIASVGEISRSMVLAYTCFPNLTVPVYSNGFPLLLFWPTSINTSRLDVVWFGLPVEGEELPPAWREKIAAFNVILDEDLTYLPSVQKSVESPAFRSIPLNYQERRIYHAHEHIDDTIGREHVPARMRTTPVLGPTVERQQDRGIPPYLKGVLGDGAGVEAAE
ncbi:MAG: Rieske 2Fe-2S domain-containing protein [Alphaproteobacteria bacterium]|nr:Rieske 2Fe-2S domain-containing protein [Alphaproteobacteria bacterium]